MLANSLLTEDNCGQNLSLLSIASALRRGSPTDEDINLITGQKSFSANFALKEETLNIDETLEKMSHLSLKNKSEALSSIGNKYANCGHYSDAIRYYSKAISLYDEDYRLYCNRSFCYEKLMKFEDSLADALRSVILMPTRPKPYFRQGKALIGLKRYSDAEKAFNKILEINLNCEDTQKELLKTRYLALRDEGLSVDDASIAAINHKSIKQAVEALQTMAGKQQRANIQCEGDSKLNIKYEYLNDSKPFIRSHNNNDRYKQFMALKTNNRFNQNMNGFQRFAHKRSQSSARPPTTFNHSNALNGFALKPMNKRSTSVDNIYRYKKNEQPFQRLDSVKRFKEYRLPKNLFGYKGLWIGNVSPNCKVTQLRAIFSRFGPVDYVNVVSNSFCAFVNYQNTNSPRIAMANLFGQIIPGISNGERPLVYRFIPSNDQKDLHFMRPYQPKGTNECYFWRTTGCKDWNCPLIHYPICRGVDFQPWMKNKYKKLY